MGNYAKPTLIEKLGALPVLGGAIFTVLSALLTSFRRGPNDEPSLYLHIMYAVTRRLVTRLSAAQAQWVFPLTDAAYKMQAKAEQFVPQVVELPHGAQGHWIGDPDAEHVLVWYHGGGFGVPASSGYFKFFARYLKSRQNTKPSLAVFFLTYTLAPTARYPTQLTQAVEALRYLVDNTKREPSRIILGGDSAGGNLVLGVLAHLTHRHKAIAELTISEPLAGAVMMAPWTALNEPDARLAGYYDGDCITPTALQTWARNYMGDAAPDYYTDASLAPAEWFRGLPAQKILVLAGKNEYLLPNINSLVKTLEAGYGSLEFYIGEGEAHIAPLLNLTYDYTTPTGQGKKLQSWVEEVIA
ncbi:hypothetical protein QQS21_010578 [Conoideocrella luteorostrata]|uniref:Alpha/beta hydrolase fold-3 domain-containing protein n=1 Tax=Conoideocrella luteorostrata TaxID=1105319 RepID=A0AAJ0CHH0_9HYPO|nr:hypothetical protein QQS21_010578 [Conoideocrella luteorostrata]